MKYIKKNLFNFIIIAFILFLPVLGLGQTTGNGLNPTTGNGLNPTGNNYSGEKIFNPIKSNTVTELIQKVLEAVVKIGMPVIVLAIIYSGFLFVTARGNSEKLGEAKNALLYTLIGAAILLGSWGIAQLITETVKAL